MIDKFLDKSSIVTTLFNSIKLGEKITVFGCEKDAKLTLLKESGKSLFFVTADIKEAVGIKEKLLESGYRVEMLMDKLDFKLSPFQCDYNAKVVEVLAKILQKQVDAVIVNPMFLLYKLPSVDYISGKTFTVEVGQVVTMDDLKSQLIRMGLSRSDSPTTNQFVVKGDMADICFNREGVRVYFDYDTIESIKIYDRETLSNINSVDSYYIYPVEWFSDINVLDWDIKDEQILEQLEMYNSKLGNILWCAQFFDNINSSIIDYLDNFVVGIADTKTIYNYIEEEVKNHNSSIKENFIKPNNYLLSSAVDFKDLPVVGYQYIINQNRLFTPTKVFNVKTIPLTNYIGNLKLLVQEIAQLQLKNYTIVVYGKDKNNSQKLADLFTQEKINFNIVGNGFGVIPHSVNIITRASGMSINLEVEKIFVLSNLYIFGKTKPILKKGESQSFNGFLPESGDFVVHSTHGIGKCLGVECLKLSLSKRDYVIIEYKNNDRLYLPVENIDLIDKYIGGDTPALNKLGGTEFLKAKEKVRATVKQLAFDLKNLYAERNSLVGYTYPKDDEVMAEFEESFGYEETADQMQAIEDIKKDMESGKVMDRLVCGDVGFGKTEVAIRCAFKTILAGRQVAFLCPTTILSQQHYNTALMRMKNFGVSIAVINRFTTTKELNKIYDGLASGDVDLVVGTHKLLNSKIKFKNLGLLVLDEEQKFGVGDKEKIKNLKKNINVLTLSATPIPRTLNMSLTGIRDISVIETPPVSRIPTAVQVCEYSPDILKSAISNELSRGGQVLIVYNKVESIYEFSNVVRNMFPDVAIDIAHGQMEQEKLENAIYKLYNSDTQILVSTTLIENGIDLPNANTLIVINADLLGLSQLYQLKGRVGRSDKQAYAYFTYDGGKILSDTALKRLEAITEYSAMGSGFKIALRDLEIRGAGSIFGAEQSGHIEKVGYAMYLKLLSESVSEIKGEAEKQKTEVKVETSLNAYIPNDYISDYNQRMSTYLKISKIDSALKLLQIIAYISEIYGEVAEEVLNLCKIALIKNLSERAGIFRVVLKPKQVQLFLSQVGEKIVNGLENFSDYLVLETKNQPIITLTKELNLDEVANLIINFLEFVAN